jgi:hypothetical protein
MKLIRWKLSSVNYLTNTETRPVPNNKKKLFTLPRLNFELKVLSSLINFKAFF